jgi:DNA repair protein RadC
MIIVTVDHAEALLAPLFVDADVERVGVLHLGSGRALIGLTLQPEGSEGEVELPVAGILGTALKLGAAGIIVAHNHPSGDPAPSAEDRAATAALARGAAAVGVRLYDHLIFGGGRSSSFVALGLL